MSVVGIDLGAQSTKVGVARNKGIDIVRLDISSLLCHFQFCDSRIHGIHWIIMLTSLLQIFFRSPMKFPTDLLRMLFLRLPLSNAIDSETDLFQDL